MEIPKPPIAPPRAFTQGVGLVFQFVGVTLFVVLMGVCCASGLLSSSTAIRTDLTHVGWGEYSVQRAIVVSLCTGIFCGIATAGLGLGMQAMHRRAPLAATALTFFGATFYLVHCVFFIATVRWWGLGAACGAAGVMFLVLLGLAGAAVREMHRIPPEKGFEILPKDYKVPYSHMHQDPPEVRLARELQERKERLAVQQKELELLEEKLKRSLEERGES